MRVLNVLLLFFCMNTHAKLQPLSDDAARNIAYPVFPTWVINNPEMMARITSTESLLALIDLVHTLRHSAAAGVPEELNYVINLQDYLNNLTNPARDLDYLSRILERVFNPQGKEPIFKFENIQSRGHSETIYLDNNGNEVFRHHTNDYIHRLSITDLRFGDTETSIGSIYISDLELAPGNITRIQVRD